MKPYVYPQQFISCKVSHACARQTGFTLIEMMISMGLLSMVMIAATAVVSLAVRAAPANDDPTSVALASRTAVDQVLSDLTDATSVSISESGGIVRLLISTQDLDSDNAPDTIEYQWSGNARDAVFRSFNGLQTTLYPHADAFSISVAGSIRSVASGTTSATATGQSIAVVQRYDRSTNLISIGTNWVAQRFKPRLKPNATSWSLTSVSLWLRRDGSADSTGLIELRADAAGRPGSFIASTQFVESALASTPRFQTYPLARSNLDPNAAYWLVLRTSILLTPARVLQTPYSVADDTAQYAISSNGSTWTVDPDAALFFQITGSVSTTSVGATPKTVADAITITLQASDPGSTAAHGAVHLPARPLLAVTGDVQVVLTDTQGLFGAIGGVLSGTGSQISSLYPGLLGGG